MACSAPEQRLRNCNGKGSPARIPLNNRLYTRCPRAVWLESLDARALVNVYFECRNTHTFPVSGGPLEQTAFTFELFDFLDTLKGELEARRQAQNAK